MRVDFQTVSLNKLSRPLNLLLARYFVSARRKGTKANTTQHLGTKRQHGALRDQDPPGVTSHDTSWVVQALWVQGGSSGCLVLSVFFFLVRAPGSSTPKRQLWIVYDA